MRIAPPTLPGFLGGRAAASDGTARATAAGAGKRRPQHVARIDGWLVASAGALSQGLTDAELLSVNAALPHGVRLVREGPGTVPRLRAEWPDDPAAVDRTRVSAGGSASAGLEVAERSAADPSLARAGRWIEDARRVATTEGRAALALSKGSFAGAEQARLGELLERAGWPVARFDDPGEDGVGCAVVDLDVGAGFAQAKIAELACGGFRLRVSLDWPDRAERPTECRDAAVRLLVLAGSWLRVVRPVREQRGAEEVFGFEVVVPDASSAARAGSWRHALAALSVALRNTAAEWDVLTTSPAAARAFLACQSARSTSALRAGQREAHSLNESTRIGFEADDRTPGHQPNNHGL